MTKKLIFLSLLVVPVVFLSGCSQEQEQTKKDVQASGQTRPAQQEEVQGTVSSKKYFEIKELGIQFPVDSDVSNDLTYIVDGSGSVVISSRRLTALGCDPKEGFMRITSSKGKPDQETQTYFEHAGGVGLKQLNGFFVTFQKAQASCWGDGKNGYTEEKGGIMIQISDKVAAGFESISTLEK